MFDFVSHNLLIKKLLLYDISEACGKWIKNPISDGRGCPWRREHGRERGTSGALTHFQPWTQFPSIILI